MGVSKRPNDVRERERRVLEMWYAGYHQEDIAETLDIDDSTVSKIIKRVLERQTNAVAAEVKERELSRLDALMNTWWPKARKGEPVATDKILKMMERRARLQGLDAPTETKADINLSAGDAKTEALAILEAMKTQEPEQPSD